MFEKERKSQRSHTKKVEIKDVDDGGNNLNSPTCLRNGLLRVAP